MTQASLTCIELVVNKEKRWILKRVLQENKARQILRKMNISYPLISMRISDMLVFREIWHALLFL